MESAASSVVIMGLPDEMSSPTIGNLAMALSKAQAKIEAAIRDGKNGHLGNKYATLDAVWDAARKPLTDSDLAIIQIPMGNDEEAVTVVTVLAHGGSGEWVRNRVTISLDKKKEEADLKKKTLGNAQAVGSAITYAKRYGFAAIAGITDMDDDDGNVSAGKKKGKEKPQDIKDKVLWIATNLHVVDDKVKSANITAWLKNDAKHTPKGTENALTQFEALTGMKYEAKEEEPENA